MSWLTKQQSSYRECDAHLLYNIASILTRPTSLEKHNPVCFHTLTVLVENLNLIYSETRQWMFCAVNHSSNFPCEATQTNSDK